MTENKDHAGIAGIKKSTKFRISVSRGLFSPGGEKYENDICTANLSSYPVVRSFCLVPETIFKMHTEIVVKVKEKMFERVHAPNFISGIQGFRGFRGISLG